MDSLLSANLYNTIADAEKSKQNDWSSINARLLID